MYFFKHKFVIFLIRRGLHVGPIRCGRRLCHFCRSGPEGVGDILRVTKISQQTQDVESNLVYRWSSVVDGRSTYAGGVRWVRSYTPPPPAGPQKVRQAHLKAKVRTQIGKIKDRPTQWEQASPPPYFRQIL